MKLTGIALWMCLVVLATASHAAVLPRVARSDVAPQVRFARMIGPVADSAIVSFNVVLGYPNPDAVRRFTDAVNDPASPMYGRFLRPAEFTAAFAPSAATYTALERELQAHGLRVTREWPNRKMIGLSARADAVQRYFATKLIRFFDGSAVRFANVTPASVPASLAGTVMAVSGLNDIVRHGPQHEEPVPKASATPEPYGYTPSQIQKVYNEPISVDPSIDGTGVTIGIEAFGRYPAKDSLDQFYKAFGITVKHPPTVVLVDSQDGTPPLSVEAVLDVEESSGNAPGAHVIFFEGPNFGDRVAEDVYGTVVDDPSIDVTSTSWGSCELLDDSEFIAVAHDFFEQGSAEGITQFAAAGDNGSNDCIGNFLPQKPPPNYPTLSVDYPGSDPEIGSSGGSRLTLDANGARKTEVAWSSDPNKNWAGGGGASAYFSMPSYQSGILALAKANTIELASTTMRDTPDFALMADPAPQGYRTCYDGCGGGGFGTSFVGPNMAALYAQIDQYTKHRMGRAATGIYYRSLANLPYPGDVFYDITSGKNGLYDAASNYDNVTGFGSFANAYDYMKMLPIPAGAPNL